jgi:arylsulfatase
VSNFLGRAHTVVSSLRPLTPGPHTIDVLYERTAPNAGTATLYLDDELQTSSTVPRTNPIAFSSTEGLEVGSDTVSPVWERYRSPFEFTGTNHEVILTTPTAEQPLTLELARAEHRMAMHQQ